MITAYVEGFCTHYEGEDIEINFAIYEDGELLDQGQELKPYQKPVLVGQMAINLLLKRLQKYEAQKISIIINDPALYEQVNDTSTNPNPELIRMAEKTRKTIAKFGGRIDIRNISYHYDERKEFAKAIKGE